MMEDRSENTGVAILRVQEHSTTGGKSTVFVSDIELWLHTKPSADEEAEWETDGSLTGVPT